MSNYNSFQNIVQSPMVTNDNLMDTVSEIRFGNRDIFATSSWDGYIRFYQVMLQTGFRPQIQLEFKDGIGCNEPILSISWKKDLSMIFAALADNTIRAYDIKTKQSVTIGIHENAPARQVFWNEDLNVLISLGLDKKLCFWQLQASTMGKPRPAYQVDLNNIPTVGEQDSNDRFFAYADVEQKLRWLEWNSIKGNQNNNRSIFKMEDSRLGQYSQITSIGINDRATRLGIASADGRSVICSIDNQLNLSNIMQFKCYKIDEDVKVSQYRTEKQSKLYMCNALQFNTKQQSWIGTCGSDGGIVFWDSEKRSKIITFKLDGPAVAGQTSPDGNIFAYAQGYDWGQGLDRINEFSPRIGAAYIEDKLLYCP